VQGGGSEALALVKHCTVHNNQGQCIAMERRCWCEKRAEKGRKGTGDDDVISESLQFGYNLAIGSRTNPTSEYCAQGHQRASTPTMFPCCGAGKPVPES
jgi:hypothetical protein